MLFSLKYLYLYSHLWEEKKKHKQKYKCFIFLKGHTFTYIILGSLKTNIILKPHPTAFKSMPILCMCSNVKNWKTENPVFLNLGSLL